MSASTCACRARHAASVGFWECSGLYAWSWLVWSWLKSTASACAHFARKAVSRKPRSQRMTSDDKKSVMSSSRCASDFFHGRIRAMRLDREHGGEDITYCFYEAGQHYHRFASTGSASPARLPSRPPSATSRSDRPPPLGPPPGSAGAAAPGSPSSKPLRDAAKFLHPGWFECGP